MQYQLPHRGQFGKRRLVVDQIWVVSEGAARGMFTTSEVCDTPVELTLKGCRVVPTAKAGNGSSFGEELGLCATTNISTC